VSSHVFAFMSGMGLIVCCRAIEERNWVFLLGAVGYTVCAAAGCLHVRVQEREP
jgi:hypothetical protein